MCRQIGIVNMENALKKDGGKFMKQKSLKLFKPHWRGLLLTLFASAALVFVNIALRRYLGASLDAALNGQIEIVQIALVGLTGISVYAALSGVKTYGAQLLQHSIRSRIYHNAYRQLIYGEGDMPSLGELTNRLSGHVTELVQAVNRFVSKASGDFCCYVFASLVLAMIHPGGAAVIVGVSILPTFFIRVLSRREQDERRQYMKEMGRVNQSASEGLYSMESVKANAMEDEFCAAYGASLEELYQKKKKLTKTTTLLTLPSVLCAFGMQITILIVGGFLTATGSITAGELVTMISLMSFIVDPVMCLENTVVALHAYRVSLDALESYLDETAPPPSEAKRLTGDACVSFKNVSFAYPGGKDILHGMTFCLRPGKIHLLRGANGSGKSTLVRLLCGTLHPQKGDIVLMGIDAKTLQPQDYESLIAVMPQENILLAGTVMENLLLCQPTATREQATAACQKADIHETILSLPDGYDTYLTENGGVLSGGQKQRISFARTLLRDAPVMIFDEPSAALDDARCAQMHAILEELSREKIVLLITHDARMLRETDDVLELGR